MWTFIRPLCIWLCLWAVPLAARGNDAQPPSFAPPVLAQAGGAAFDGTWDGRGTLVSVGGRGTDCGGPSIGHRLTVNNGQLTIEYSPPNGIRFAGPVAADGRFDLYSGPSHFAGQFAGGTMTATFRNRSCERNWRFRRQAAG
ncbi:hypothetical protein ACQW02_03870 [Humitalea sp. 24SJ18S-53]|uniref:hypothetical protein n=1 Tax=Humitalea sp. 24SJ18S-53 TaxID=3422307 RepID=UPI003D66917B